ncbi:hypothetical protein EMEDMD4_220095 [Sinorhizobium medicae]|uniref:Uncharacterized protein n=1 Tax=Sinorhizobium medicae TaxID=110321 RepID=A0A508WTV7_9HYPH|nr:hypothetical protein EMEDMD4_220095 [Sinorhizobium medicae]
MLGPRVVDSLRLAWVQPQLYGQFVYEG